MSRARCTVAPAWAATAAVWSEESESMTTTSSISGVLAGVRAASLAATVIGELVRRTGLPPESVDDVILGQCNPNGEAPAIGRVAALDAGLPAEVPGFQLDRRCGSGLQAVLLAAM